MAMESSRGRFFPCRYLAALNFYMVHMNLPPMLWTRVRTIFRSKITSGFSEFVFVHVVIRS